MVYDGGKNFHFNSTISVDLVYLKTDLPSPTYISPTKGEFFEDPFLLRSCQIQGRNTWPFAGVPRNSNDKRLNKVHNGQWSLILSKGTSQQFFYRIPLGNCICKKPLQSAFERVLCRVLSSAFESAFKIPFKRKVFCWCQHFYLKV